MNQRTSDRLNLGELEELPSSSDVEVGDTNVLDEALVDELLHLGPSGRDIVGKLNIEELLSGLALDGVFLGGKDTFGSIDLQVDLSISSFPFVKTQEKAYVPVHEVKVKVLETQVLQGVLDGQLDVFGVMVELEKLGGDPKLLSGDTGSLDSLSDLGLVSVSPGAADSQRLLSKLDFKG